MSISEIDCVSIRTGSSLLQVQCKNTSKVKQWWLVWKIWWPKSFAYHTLMWRIHYVFLLLNLWNKLLDPLRWHHEAHSSVSNMMINHWMIQQKCWSLWLSNKCTAKSVLSQDIMPGHKFHSRMIIQTQHQSTLKSKFMCSSYWHKHWNKFCIHLHKTTNMK